MKRWGKVFLGGGINLDQDLTKQRWQVPETKRSSCGESREFKGESRMMLSRGVRGQVTEGLARRTHPEGHGCGRADNGPPKSHILISGNCERKVADVIKLRTLRWDYLSKPNRITSVLITIFKRGRQEDQSLSWRCDNRSRGQSNSCCLLRWQKRP